MFATIRIRKFSPALFWMLAATLFLHASASSANLPAFRGESFRGMPFGASLADFNAKKWELTPSNDAGGDKNRFQSFIRMDEQKSMGDLLLLEVTYYFLDGKFYGVLLQTPDGCQTEILNQALLSSRGEPYHTVVPADGLVWIGSLSTAILQRNRETGEASLMIFGNALQKGFEAYVKDAGGKISKDL
jgi:hypothetical protein